MPCRIPLPEVSSAFLPHSTSSPSSTLRQQQMQKASTRRGERWEGNVHQRGRVRLLLADSHGLRCLSNHRYCNTQTPIHPHTRRMFRLTALSLKLSHRYHHPFLLPSLFFLPLSPPLSLLSSFFPTLQTYNYPGNPRPLSCASTRQSIIVILIQFILQCGCAHTFHFFPKLSAMDIHAHCGCVRICVGEAQCLMDTDTDTDTHTRRHTKNEWHGPLTFIVRAGGRRGY
jgi:hypothetical protein